MRPSTVTPIGDLDLPQLDFADPAVAADPYAAVRAASAEHWLAAIPGGFAVTRWDEAKAVARDRRFRTPPGLGLATYGITEGFAYEWASGVLLGLDGEDHARIRRLTAPGLAPRRLDELRPFARQLVTELADDVDDGDRRFDAATFGEAYSVRMICRLLGFPDDDWARLAAWSDAAVQLPTVAVIDQLDRIEQALRDLRAYTTEQIAAIRTRERGDDLGSILLSAQEAGDRLSPDELVQLFEALLMAGAETTKTVLAMGLSLFARHPEQWQAIADDPMLAAPAVEEVLRFRIPQLGVGRVAREDAVVNGVAIPAGTFCLVAVPAANFDPLVFDDPDTFSIHRASDGSRRPTQGHLSFGSGVHVCVGAYLARLELEEAFRLLSRRWPELRPDDEDPIGIRWNSPFGVHGPIRLPLRWG
jgi:cytochrome P450